MVQQEQAKVLRDFDDLDEQEEPVVAPSRFTFNKKFGFAALGIAAVCGLVGASIATFGGSSSSDSSVVDEFSASGVVTSSLLEGTPENLGEATFGVYFNRDQDTKAITFEMTVAATDSSGHTITASVLDGQFSLWTTGPVSEYTDESQFSVLPSVGGMNLYDCDFTVVPLQDWSENYAIDTVGDKVSINLGPGGIVTFTLDASTGLPNAVAWGELEGSITTFDVASKKLKGALGTKVPIEYPCVAVVETVVTTEIAAEVTEAEVDATLVAIIESESDSRKLTEAEHAERKLRVGSSVDADMMLLSDGSYSRNDCGGARGWSPAIAIQSGNAYAQVCIKNRVCAISFRGSDDLRDWISNIQTVAPWATDRVGGVDVPTGFNNELNRLKGTSAWSQWERIKNSSSCRNGVVSTGHSLGGAIASINGFDDNDVTDVVTFASPKMGGRGEDCGGDKGRRYYITNVWGSDPVPGLPPFTTHPHNGYEMFGYWRWGRRTYRLINRGCRDQGGGGIWGFNIVSHFQFSYVNRAERLLR